METIPLIIAVVILMLFGFNYANKNNPKKPNKKKAEKAKKEKMDELKKKDAANVVDDLPNAKNIRTIIRQGTVRLFDRIGKALHRAGSKGTDTDDNPDS